MQRKCLNLNNDKYFSKTINQLKFDYGLSEKSPRIIVTRGFSSSSFKLKKKYPSPLTR